LTLAEDPEFELLYDFTKAALNDQFIISSSENGIKRWEVILKIILKATNTLDERRFTILTRLAEQLPYTIRMLKNMLVELCGKDGYVMELAPDKYMLGVSVALTAASKFYDVEMMLRRICPANLVVQLSIIYNQWFKFKPFTWGALQAKTWFQMRNEVL
jgi:hypothetical protein